MRDPSTSPAFLRVERDLRVSGITCVFTWPPQGSVELVLSFPGAPGAVGIGFLPGEDEEYETFWVADHFQEFVVEHLERGRVRTWPRALTGGSPMWAAFSDGEAVWESADGTEIYRIGELPEGR